MKLRNKGQSEIIIFVILFLIAVILFSISLFWGRDIFQKNIDSGKVSSIEGFVKNLDNRIQSTIKFGGEQVIDYRLNAVIQLVDIYTIEIQEPVKIEMPNYWINITPPNSPTVIREMLDGDVFRIQLYYPPEKNDIELFTEGPRVANPKTIKIEKTYVSNKIRIKLIFQ